MRFKDRQEEAANFRDTKLTKSNTSAAEKSQGGVVNTHAYGKLQGDSYAAIGEGLAAGIGHAKEFKDGYDLAKVEQEHSANINKYLDEANAVSDATQERDIAVNTEERMWDTFSKDEAEGKGAQIVDTINIASANTAKEITKLAAAKKQGRMSSAEFVANSTRITREAIARHPTLADEILGSTKRLWEIAGVRTQMDLDKVAKTAAINAAVKKEDRIIAAYQKAGGGNPPLDSEGNYEIEYMTDWLASYDKEQAGIDTFESVVKNEAMSVYQKARVLLKKNSEGKSPLTIKRDQIEKNFLKVSGDSLKLAEGDPIAQAEVIKGIRLEAENIKKGYDGATRPLYEDKEIKYLADNATARIDAYVDILEKQLKKEDITTAIASAQAAEEFSTDKFIEGITHMPAGQFKALMKVWAFFPKGELIHRFPDLAGKLPLLMEKLVSPNTKVSGSITVMSEGEQVGLDTTVYSSVQSQRVTPSPEGKLAVNNGVLAQIKSITDKATDLEKFEQSDMAVAKWMNPKMTGVHEDLTPENLATVNKAMNTRLDIINKNMIREVAEARKLGHKVEVTYDNGELAFSGHPATTQRLTTLISKRVRDTRRATAMLNGWGANDPKAVAFITANMPNIKQELEFSSEMGKGRADVHKGRYNTEASSKEVERRQKEKAKLKTLEGTELAEEQKNYYN
tara:strand:- start:55 stop:2097 length:2043 start_codon:yes stop_codon:yes gene_type:complete